MKDRALYFKKVDGRWFMENRKEDGRRRRRRSSRRMVRTPIDLRSDTVTRPTPGMRAAMAAAEVGDDVFDEDPTVNRLQDRVAELLGKEAALFVPSGTMANQICVRVHTQPGDELICETTSHIYIWEAGGPAVLSGVTSRTVDGDYGVLDVEQLRGQDPARVGALRAHAAGVPGEHAQPRRRPRLPAREDSGRSPTGRMPTGW